MSVPARADHQRPEMGSGIVAHHLRQATRRAPQEPVVSQSVVHSTGPGLGVTLGRGLHCKVHVAFLSRCSAEPTAVVSPQKEGGLTGFPALVT
jgi:hypothetical protein